MRCTAALSLIMLALSTGTSLGACLPTLGTEDCFRAWDLRVQTIEHRYLDVPLYLGHPKHERLTRLTRRKPET